MKARYATLALYFLCLAAIAGVWLWVEWSEVTQLPAAWIVGLSIAGSLFVWQYGVQAPRVGLISMERVPQVGLLLIFSPPVAAAICGLASLLWPLLSRRYSH